MVTYRNLAASLVRARRSVRRIEESERKLERRAKGLSRILAEFRETLKSGRGQKIRGQLSKATRIATTLLDDLDFIELRIDRTQFKLRNIALDAEHGLSGLDSLWARSLTRGSAETISSLESKKKNLDGLRKRLVEQRVELKQASIKAEWHYKIDLCVDQFRAGYDQLGLARLLEICYGPDTPSEHRRRALNELLSWGHTVDSSELVHLATNHLSSYSIQGERISASERELVLRIEGLRATRAFSDPEAFLLLLDALRRSSEDAILAAANLVSTLDLSSSPRIGAVLQLLWINKVYSLKKLEPLEFNPSFSPVLFDQVDCNIDESEWVTNGALVTVIVPAWNSAPWLPTTVRGLCKQTWRNLEIIIVDDCSEDNTLEVARELAKADSRIKVISNPSNVGAYASRNAALAIAKGTYITVHDADDWSHPRKIERQVAHLQANGNIVANMSQSVRIDQDDLIFFAQYGREFMRQNSSSLLFRKDQVFSELGFWDEVKFGADTEFHHRIKARFGADSAPVAKLGLLSLTRFHSASLTGGGQHSTKRGIVGARRDYLAKFDAWHVRGKEAGESLYMPRSADPRPFAIPTLVELDDQRRAHFDLVVVANLSILTPWLAKVYSTSRKLKSQGKTIAFLHLPGIERPTQAISEAFEQLVSDGVAIRIYSETEAFSTRALVQASAMSASNELTPALSTERLELILDALSPEVRLAEAIERAEQIFGVKPALFGASAETKVYLRSAHGFGSFWQGLEI